MNLNVKYSNIDNSYTDEIQLEPHEVLLLELNKL